MSRGRTDQDANAAGSQRVDGDAATTTSRPAATVDEAVARQREDFGGIKWGSAFFGWLTAMGVAALLTAGLTAAGTAIGLTQVDGSDAQAQATEQAETVGIAGGIALLVVLMLAYYAGGYVAGRMARLDGARQGLGVWAIGLIITVLLAVAGAVLGAKYNVLASLNLPRIPVDEGDLATGGLIALAAVLVGTALAAVFGGKVGTRYHRRLDSAVYPG
jgi:hypothetical protein